MIKLIMGPWADLLADFHKLLGVFAKARTEAEARSKVRAWGQIQGFYIGKAMGEVRHAMSVKVVRSQSLCLLERLSQLGPGAQAAGDGRKVVRKSKKDKPKLTTSHRETEACAELAVHSSLETLNSEF